jgi:hypothetical protein
LRLLKESSATNDGNKDVVDADSTSVVIQHKDYELLKYPFVGGFEIEKATKVLDLCRGAGTALDGKHSSREEIQLCDFWMCWITRKESTSKSCVHIFSTHFYSTLMNDGVGGVSRWTTREGLDTFTKNMLFITVNLNSHWSIVAVFNAGMINADLVEDESGCPYYFEAPALIHLDSLKLYDGAVIARNIRTWLNHESGIRSIV